MMAWLHDAHNWVALSFVIFAIGAFVMGRKPVAAKLDARIGVIRRDLDAAEALKTEATALLAQYRQRQQDAEAEAARIVVNARTHAEDLRAGMEADMHETATRRQHRLAERLRRMEDNAQAEMRAYAAELAVRATAQLIAANLDEPANARLIDATITDLARDAA